jgi:hypothetical protein
MTSFNQMAWRHGLIEENFNKRNALSILSIHLSEENREDMHICQKYLENVGT